MNYLLDTNICIYIIKKNPEKVIKKLESIVCSGIKNDIFLSSVTISELFYGIAKSIHQDKNRESIKGFLSPFQIVNFDTSSAQIFGEIRFDLEKKGTIIGPYDMQIASIALANDLTLVTNNVKEFKRIKHLKIENWV
jgi:tRNA(fMet)-specific endonuclease VapC